MNRYFQTPPVVKNLIIINVLVYMATALLPVGDTIMQYSALSLGTPYFHAYQFITFMLQHATFEHIFFNMFALWMFGRTLEQVWGPKRFLFYYILCGIGAGLVQEGVQYIQYVTELVNYEGVNTGVAVIPMAEYLNLMTTVGASGAVYAILLAFGMLFPNSQMFVFTIPIPIKA